MKNKLKLIQLYTVFLALFIFVSQYVNAQNDFKFKRKILVDSVAWSTFDIPENLWDKLKKDAVDARILQIKDKDTMEVPYFLNFPNLQQEFTSLDFSILNQHTSNNFNVLTLDFFKSVNVDKMILDFIPVNFEYWLEIEGSNDLTSWYVIDDSYRLVGVQNEFKSFKSNEIYLTNLRYRYYKIKFKHQQKTDLKGLTAFQKNTVPFSLVNYSVQSQKSIIKNKKSIIYINLKNNVPIYKLSLNRSDSVYFHRYVTVKYISDSVLTPKGYVFSYDFIWSGYIHSQQNNDIFCNNVKAKNIVITIENEDNPAVNFKKINLYGLPFAIVFNAQNLNDYFLFYGNPSLLKPNYDLQYFKAQIPKHLNTLTLQNEELLQNIVPENKSDYNLLLYLVLGIIVIVLLFFSFKMLKESKN
jgi:hypothetical protein